MHRLTNVEAQRMMAVLEEVTSSANLVSWVTPETVKQMDNPQGIFGTEVHSEVSLSKCILFG